ncbi:sigma-70 family RNA polymerase sigma factor [Senegalia massiliensis]|uniref:sigma-70 family RNA polymerase sigma factor n=1 Tax=Senegalia massiliensis TaxID=1720316 RepID=UPI001030D7DB|nr:sigma-70 family RNA polymerase sigma factor [Senegalia massiliensis]
MGIKGIELEFYKILNENKDQLYRIAYSYLGDKEEALDAIQEITYKGYTNLHKLKKKEYMKTWTIRILINYCINRKKKMKRKVELYKEFEDGNINFQQDLEVHDLVDRLKPKYREIIILKYFEDLTISEISNILDTPEGTIKTRLSRGLNSLREGINIGGDVNEI